MGMSKGTHGSTTDAAERLLKAERQGLRLAILCRTIAVASAFAWVVGASYSFGSAPNPWAVTALLVFTAFGLAALAVTGTALDRWWLKYAIYAVDILGVCAVFAVVPVSRGGEVPQIIAFRAYGIYYLFPLIAMASLSLSWRLVAWSGLVAFIGWWTAFVVAVSPMERRLSWADVPDAASRDVYEAVFLSPDFIGVGNRVEETGLLLVASLILALTVYRARRVFFAQIAAEAEREAERASRERITLTLGRYVPEAVALRLIEDESALAPQVRHGAALIMDIRDFTAFAAERDPQQVITALNAFLARCADVVSANGGVVITFTGDGLLATFNTPLEISRPEAAALKAARALSGLSGNSGFHVRVGVAAGPIAAGSVGSSNRQAFTVYGDTVNRAARLEQLAKELGEDIAVDEMVAGAVPTAADLRPAGPHEVKGIATPIKVWTVGAAVRQDTVGDPPPLGRAP